MKCVKNKIMKRLLVIVSVVFFVVGCSQTTKNESQDDSTTIVWIEDKQGPTIQEHQIFPTVPDSIWNELGLQDGVPSSISCFLLQIEGKTILIDAGLGAPFSQLQPKMSELNVKPDELDLIYITHLHPDHIGGLLKDDTVVFPHAELYINRVEVDTWLSMEGERSMLAKKVLAAYKDHLHCFNAGDTLPGGVQTIAAYGHTPGHTLFQKDSILVIADLIHGAALQMEHPEFCPFFDMAPVMATETRVRILQYARENKLTMYGMHLPNPGNINF